MKSWVAWKTARGICVVVAFILLASCQPGGAPPMDAPRVRLLEALVSQVPAQTEILVAELPAGVGAIVPLPEEGTLLGSLTTNLPPPEGGRTVSILFETPRPATAALDSYTAQLLGAGWEEQRRIGEGWGGFEEGSGSLAGSPRLFCRGNTTDQLIVHALVPRASEPVLFRLSLNHQQANACGRERTPARPPTSATSPLPALHAPDDGYHMVQGTSGGSEYWEVKALAWTAVPARNVARHYGRQLVEKGWHRQGEEVQDSAVWSSWTFQDEDGVQWAATLIAARVAGKPETWMVTLRADRM